MIWSTIVSVASACWSAATSIGSAIGRAVSTVAGRIGDAIEKGAEWLGRVNGAFANGFAERAGIIRPGERVEDFGERALQAKERIGLKLESSDEFNAYMEKLRSFDLDPEVASKRGKGEKMAAGMAVINVGLEHKFDAPKDSLAAIWMLPLIDPKFFTPERVHSIVAAGETGRDLLAYLEGRLTPDEGLAAARGIIKQQGRGDAEVGLPEWRDRLGETRAALKPLLDGADFDQQLEKLRAKHEQAGGASNTGG